MGCANCKKNTSDVQSPSALPPIIIADQRFFDKDNKAGFLDLQKELKKHGLSVLMTGDQNQRAQSLDKANRQHNNSISDRFSTPLSTPPHISQQSKRTRMIKYLADESSLIHNVAPAFVSVSSHLEQSINNENSLTASKKRKQQKDKKSSQNILSSKLDRYKGIKSPVPNKQSSQQIFFNALQDKLETQNKAKQRRLVNQNQFNSSESETITKSNQTGGFQNTDSQFASESQIDLEDECESIIIVNPKTGKKMKMVQYRGKGKKTQGKMPKISRSNIRNYMGQQDEFTQQYNAAFEPLNKKHSRQKSQFSSNNSNLQQLYSNPRHQQTQQQTIPPEMFDMCHPKDIERWWKSKQQNNQLSNIQGLKRNQRTSSSVSTPTSSNQINSKMMPLRTLKQRQKLSKQFSSSQNDYSSSPHDLPMSKFQADKNFTENKRIDPQLKQIREQKVQRIPYMQRIGTTNTSQISQIDNSHDRANKGFAKITQRLKTNQLKNYNLGSNMLPDETLKNRLYSYQSHNAANKVSNNLQQLETNSKYSGKGNMLDDLEQQYDPIKNFTEDENDDSSQIESMRQSLESDGYENDDVGMQSLEIQACLKDKLQKRQAKIKTQQTQQTSQDEEKRKEFKNQSKKSMCKSEINDSGWKNNKDKTVDEEIDNLGLNTLDKTISCNITEHGGIKQKQKDKKKRQALKQGNSLLNEFQVKQSEQINQLENNQQIAYNNKVSMLQNSKPLQRKDNNRDSQNKDIQNQTNNIMLHNKQLQQNDMAAINSPEKLQNQTGSEVSYDSKKQKYQNLVINIKQANSVVSKNLLNNDGSLNVQTSKSQPTSRHLTNSNITTSSPSLVSSQFQVQGVAGLSSKQNKLHEFSSRQQKMTFQEGAQKLTTNEVATQKKINPEINTNQQQKCQRDLQDLAVSPFHKSQMSYSDYKQYQNYFNRDFKDGYFAPDQVQYYLQTYPHEQEKHIKPIPITKWQLGKMIGHGSFGNVYEGIDQRHGRQIAVKQVPISIIGNNEGTQQRKIKALKQEIKLLNSLQHKNIVKYLGANEDSQHLNVFLEFVPHGSLYQHYKTFKFTENVVATYTHQILLGLEYLHYNNIVHRDIKAANILLRDDGTCQLADFGSSKKIIETTKDDTKSFCGTPYWMAPEVVKATGHNRFADIWSLGCTVYEMIVKEPPWMDKKNKNVVFKVLNKIAETTKPPRYPKGLSRALQDFLDCCFQTQPNMRANVYELLRHPFITKEEFTMPLAHQKKLQTINEAHSTISDDASCFSQKQQQKQQHRGFFNRNDLARAKSQFYQQQNTQKTSPYQVQSPFLADVSPYSMQSTKTQNNVAQNYFNNIPLGHQNRETNNYQNKSMIEFNQNNEMRQQKKDLQQQEWQNQQQRFSNSNSKDKQKSNSTTNNQQQSKSSQKTQRMMQKQNNSSYNQSENNPQYSSGQNTPQNTQQFFQPLSMQNALEASENSYEEQKNVINSIGTAQPAQGDPILAQSRNNSQLRPFQNVLNNGQDMDSQVQELASSSSQNPLQSLNRLRAETGDSEHDDDPQPIRNVNTDQAGSGARKYTFTYENHIDRRDSVPFATNQNQINEEFEHENQSDTSMNFNQEMQQEESVQTRRPFVEESKYGAELFKSNLTKAAANQEILDFGMSPIQPQPRQSMNRKLVQRQFPEQKPLNSTNWNQLRQTNIEEEKFEASVVSNQEKAYKQKLVPQRNQPRKLDFQKAPSFGQSNQKSENESLSDLSTGKFAKSQSQLFQILQQQSAATANRQQSRPGQVEKIMNSEGINNRSQGQQMYISHNKLTNKQSNLLQQVSSAASTLHVPKSQIAATPSLASQLKKLCLDNNLTDIEEAESECGSDRRQIATNYSKDGYSSSQFLTHTNKNLVTDQNNIIDQEESKIPAKQAIKFSSAPKKKHTNLQQVEEEIIKEIARTEAHRNTKEIEPNKQKQKGSAENSLVNKSHNSSQEEAKNKRMVKKGKLLIPKIYIQDSSKSNNRNTESDNSQSSAKNSVGNSCCKSGHNNSAQSDKQPQNVNFWRNLQTPLKYQPFNPQLQNNQEEEKQPNSNIKSQQYKQQQEERTKLEVMKAIEDQINQKVQQHKWVAQSDPLVSQYQLKAEDIEHKLPSSDSDSSSYKSPEVDSDELAHIEGDKQAQRKADGK